MKFRNLLLGINSSRHKTLGRAGVYRRKLIGPEKVSYGSINAKDRNCDGQNHNSNCRVRTDPPKSIPTAKSGNNQKDSSPKPEKRDDNRQAFRRIRP